MAGQIYFSNGPKLQGYSIRDERLTNQVTLPQPVQQLVASRHDKLFAFNFIEQVCYLLSSNLKVMRSFELKIHFSGRL